MSGNQVITRSISPRIYKIKRKNYIYTKVSFQEENIHTPILEIEIEEQVSELLENNEWDRKIDIDIHINIGGKKALK